MRPRIGVVFTVNLQLTILVINMEIKSARMVNDINYPQTYINIYTHTHILLLLSDVGLHPGFCIS